MVTNFMILQRFARALRAQDWLTVLIELLIVIAGIFIALQVDHWNQERQQRALERAHLEQLKEDAAANAASLQEYAEMHRKLAADLESAIAMVKRGRLEPGEAEEFKWIMLLMHRYPPLEVTTGGYDTVIASGDFSLLRDRILKSRLVAMHSFLEQAPQRMNAIRPDELAGYPPDGSVLAVPHPGGRGVAWEVNFEQLAADSRTLAVLALERRSHAVIGDMFADGARQAEELRDYIGTLQARSGAVPQE